MIFFNKNSFLLILIILIQVFTTNANSNDEFESWLLNYKDYALKNGISQKTIDISFENVKFIDQVIKYDRKQPEFFEDTITYVNKRANSSRVKKAKKLYLLNKTIFETVEKEFNVDKKILLALWGIETNFGKHVGKMDIISCLATLSFDKRRREFFSSQLLTLLKLVDDDLIDPTTLYGSWAGAFGNFQFMPSTIKNYAIDYDGNNKIELKNSLSDALASAANYINQIGWKKGEPCFYKVSLNKQINKKYYTNSARKIKVRLKLSEWKKKGVLNLNDTDANKSLRAALILPDGDENSPAYLVFNNYEKILNWNRSLRFGISVCTLANEINL